MHALPPLTWLEPGEDLPDPEQAWGEDSPAPGLLAAGTELSPERVLQAYRQGCFPWFSAGQPVLWWSPDPRMVLAPQDFRLHRSLRQTLKRWWQQPGFELVFDRDFTQVMTRCAQQRRRGQQGTWILPAMVQAYSALHRQGLAHSAEVRINGQLVAGLYFISLGRMVFGESMFTDLRDGSKMALALLVSVARQAGVALIDCQQNTRHLASLGAAEIDRQSFLRTLHDHRDLSGIDWAGESLCWAALEA
jgi:leucyl/phenylalanyl-tRNA---protein transferase